MADHGEATSWEETLDRELASAGRPVTPATPVSELIPGTSIEEDEGDNRVISLSQLRDELAESLQIGEALSDSIYDASGVLLLAAGSRITERFLELLRARGVTQVRMRRARPRREQPPPEAPRDVISADDLTTWRSRELYERWIGDFTKPVKLAPVKAWRRPRLSIDDLKGEAARGVERHEATSAAVSSLGEALRAGRARSAAELRGVVNRFVDMAAVDFDLLPLIVAMQHSTDEYLYDHCVNVSLVSMTLASQLGLDHESITQIGLGGMLHDIGMLRVPLSIRTADRPLTEREWHEIHRHPLHTLDMLADLRGVPAVVKFVGHQVHERINGDGYPNGRSGQQLHKFSEIVAIADVFTAMTRARPHRAPLTPYAAVKAILIDGSANLFDRTLVRALLDSVSVFPTGSTIGLSNGMSAQVLRANPDQHTRPVVEELAGGAPTGRIIDLSADQDLRVIAAR